MGKKQERLPADCRLVGLQLYAHVIDAAADTRTMTRGEVLPKSTLDLTWTGCQGGGMLKPRGVVSISVPVHYGEKVEERGLLVYIRVTGNWI